VKIAAAAALGKLSKARSLSCLQQRRSASPSAREEPDPEIAGRACRARAHRRAASSAGPDTKVYVAIQVTNKTKRPAAEVEGLVRTTMQSKILAKAGFAVAPKAETPAQGGQIVKSKKLKGFFLIATVEPPVYDGRNLTQLVRVSMWSYPDKALQGEFSPKLTPERHAVARHEERRSADEALHRERDGDLPQDRGFVVMVAASGPQAPQNSAGSCPRRLARCARSTTPAEFCL
jgi:hypothetical protein